MTPTPTPEERITQLEAAVTMLIETNNKTADKLSRTSHDLDRLIGDLRRVVST